MTLIAVKFVTPLFTIESNLSIGGGKPVALRTNSKNSLRHMPPTWLFFAYFYRENGKSKRCSWEECKRDSRIPEKVV